MEEKMKKRFMLGDILTVTTGRLVADIDGIYKVVDFVLGPDFGVMTHQLPLVIDVVREEIFRQHPDLSYIVYPELQLKSEYHIWKWVGQMGAEYGHVLMLEQVGPSLLDLDEKDFEDEAPLDRNNAQFNKDAYEL
jgi:hypothetical protein